MSSLIGAALFVVLLVGYSIFAINISQGLDRADEVRQQQWLQDKARCESKGGIATKSRWDGQITGCDFPPASTQDKEGK